MWLQPYDPYLLWWPNAYNPLHIWTISLGKKVSCIPLWIFLLKSVEDFSLCISMTFSISHFCNLPTLVGNNVWSEIWDVPSIYKDTWLLLMRISCGLFLSSTLPPNMPQREEKYGNKLSHSEVCLMLCLGLCIKKDTLLLFSEVWSAFGLFFFIRGNFLFLSCRLPMTLDSKRIKFCNLEQ